MQQSVEISPTVCNSIEFLKCLSRTKSQKKRERLLNGATSEQLLALVEICMNILQNRFHITARQRARMMPYADFVRQVGRVRSERGARKLLVQKGGQLPIGLFASLLTPIISELASRILQH
jgi:hypothetical protein